MAEALVEYALPFLSCWPADKRESLYRRVGALGMLAQLWDMTSSAEPGAMTYLWRQAALDVAVEMYAPDDAKRPSP